MNEKVLGFLSVNACDKMMTHAIGQRETNQKQII